MTNIPASYTLGQGHQGVYPPGPPPPVPPRPPLSDIYGRPQSASPTGFARPSQTTVSAGQGLGSTTSTSPPPIYDSRNDVTISSQSAQHPGNTQTPIPNNPYHQTSPPAQSQRLYGQTNAYSNYSPYGQPPSNRPSPYGQNISPYGQTAATQPYGYGQNQGFYKSPYGQSTSPNVNQQPTYQDPQQPPFSPSKSPPLPNYYATTLAQQSSSMSFGLNSQPPPPQPPPPQAQRPMAAEGPMLPSPALGGPPSVQSKMHPPGTSGNDFTQGTPVYPPSADRRSSQYQPINYNMSHVPPAETMHPNSGQYYQPPSVPPSDLTGLSSTHEIAGPMYPPSFSPPPVSGDYSPPPGPPPPVAQTRHGYSASTPPITNVSVSSIKPPQNYHASEMGFESAYPPPAWTQPLIHPQMDQQSYHASFAPAQPIPTTTEPPRPIDEETLFFNSSVDRYREMLQKEQSLVKEGKTKEVLELLREFLEAEIVLRRQKYGVPEDKPPLQHIVPEEKPSEKRESWDGKRIEEHSFAEARQWQKYDGPEENRLKRNSVPQERLPESYGIPGTKLESYEAPQERQPVSYGIPEEKKLEKHEVLEERRPVSYEIPEERFERHQVPEERQPVSYEIPVEKILETHEFPEEKQAESYVIPEAKKSEGYEAPQIQPPEIYGVPEEKKLERYEVPQNRELEGYVIPGGEQQENYEVPEKKSERYEVTQNLQPDDLGVTEEESWEVHDIRQERQTESYWPPEEKQRAYAIPEKQQPSHVSRLSQSPPPTTIPPAHVELRGLITEPASTSVRVSNEIKKSIPASTFSAILTNTSVYAKPRQTPLQAAQGPPPPSTALPEVKARPLASFVRGAHESSSANLPAVNEFTQRLVSPLPKSEALATILSKASASVNDDLSLSPFRERLASLKDLAWISVDQQAFEKREEEITRKALEEVGVRQEAHSVRQSKLYASNNWELADQEEKAFNEELQHQKGDEMKQSLKRWRSEYCDPSYEKLHVNFDKLTEMHKEITQLEGCENVEEQVQLLNDTQVAFLDTISQLDILTDELRRKQHELKVFKAQEKDEWNKVDKYEEEKGAEDQALKDQRDNFKLSKGRLHFQCIKYIIDGSTEILGHRSRNLMTELEKVFERLHSKTFGPPSEELIEQFKAAETILKSWDQRINSLYSLLEQAESDLITKETGPAITKAFNSNDWDTGEKLRTEQLVRKAELVEANKQRQNERDAHFNTFAERLAKHITGGVRRGRVGS